MKPYIKRLYPTFFTLIMGGALGLQTCPANEVITSVSSGPAFTGMSNFTFGYEFTVGSQPISVNSLGVSDPSSGVGLNYSHDVGLWDNSGNLLASVTIPSGNSSTLSASGFWYEPISGSVTLSPNTIYVLGAKYPLYGPNMDFGRIQATTTSDPEVSFGTARVNFATMTFAFPDTVLGGFLDAGYFGPNMDYSVASAVPETASSCAMLGLGLLALECFRRTADKRKHPARQQEVFAAML